MGFNNRAHMKHAHKFENKMHQIYAFVFHWTTSFANRESESRDTLPWFKQTITRQFLINLELRKIDTTMHGDELAESSDLLSWYEWILTPIGIWPKDNNNLRFALIFVYILIHQTTEYADLVYDIKNIEGIMLNLCESINFTILLVKFALLHKNQIMGQLIDIMNEHCADSKFRTLEEQRKCAVYNSMAKTFKNIFVPLFFTTGILYSLKPMAGYLITTTQDGPTPFVLPLRTYIFYEITNVYTYALTYMYQVGALCIIDLGSVASDGLFVALTMHVCGQLSALAESITNITKDKNTAHYLKIRNIVERHLKLIWMMKQINKVFSTALFGQLFGYSSVICLGGYHVIVNSETTQMATFVTFILYEATMLTFLYAYCFAGECLIDESQRVRDAFYQCDWYELQPSRSMDFLICIAGSEKPINLTAGKFCIFSMELYAQVVRTAVGYVSVLRTMTLAY